MKEKHELPFVSFRTALILLMAGIYTIVWEVSPVFATLTWPAPPEGEVLSGEISSILQTDIANGEVGIGTNDPSSRLAIVGTGGHVTLTADSVDGDNGDCADTEEQVFLSPTGINIGFVIDSETITTVGAGFVCTSDKAIAWTGGQEKWWKDPTTESVFDDSGFLGINTGAPAQALDVNGRAVLRGVPIVAASTWFDNGYRYRKKLTIDNTLVAGAGDLTAFPVLVSLTDAELKSAGNGGRVNNANGYDIIFADSTDSTRLAHEIESYDATTGTINMWVSIPTLSGSVDTDFYIYYGNSGVSTSQENAPTVWTAFEAVYHLNGVFTDSAKSHDGTNLGTTASAGIIGNGRNFNDTKIEIPDDGASLDNADNMTVSLWMKPSSTTNYNKAITKGNASGGARVSWEIAIDTNASNRWIGSFFNTTDQESFSRSSVVATLGTWRHVTSVKTGNSISIYTDGTFSNTAAQSYSGTPYDADGSLYIGSNVQGWGQRFFGDIDEVRIAKTNLSANWIKTEHDNQVNQGVGSGKFIKAAGGVENGWFNSGYGYRKKLTIDNTLVSGNGNLTDFPVLVSITDTDLKTAGNGGHVNSANGFDIIFSDSNNSTQLAHEIESYDAASGQIRMWVKLPTLSGSTDTDLYVYYGNSGISTTQEDVTNVWDSNYKGVWHLNETPAAPNQDSTSNNYDGTPSSMEAGDQVAGMINGSLDFDGAAEFSNVGNPAGLQLTGNMTLSAWVYADADPLDDGDIISKWSTPSKGWVLKSSPDTGQHRFAVCVASDATNATQRHSSTIRALNTWYYVTGVYNTAGPSLDIYVNGVLDNGTLYNAIPASQYNSDQNVNIGRRPNNGWRFDGKIDEMRVSNSVRSADWIKTEFENQNNQGNGSGKFIKAIAPEENSAGLAVLTTTLQIPAGNTGLIRFNGDTAVTGAFSVTGSAGGTTGWTTSSDLRLKDNIQPLSGLDAILKLQGVRFEWKANGKPSIGVIAQDVEKVFPEIVATKDDALGSKSVDYAALVAPLIEAVKELKVEQDELQKELEELEAKSAQ